MARARALLTVLWLIAWLGLALPPGQIAQAAAFTVDLTADEPHSQPLNGNCTSTPSNRCTLRAAIQAANSLGATGGPHTITVPAGTYTLTVGGPDENAAATGDLDVTTNVIVNGAGLGATFVNGNAADRVFDVAAGASATISSLTIQNGNPPAGSSGGGVANQGVLTLSNVAVTGNAVTGSASGGGVLNSPGAGLTLNNVTISGNTAPSGAGLANNGSVIAGSLPGTVFTIGNNTAGNQGAGILNAGPGSMTLTNATVSGNTTTTGTAQTPSAGAGVLNTTNATLTLIGATLSGNTATGTTTTSLGGGLYNFQSTANLTNVTISGNAASFGGGLYNSNGPATLKNVTIASNTVTSGSFAGGGIYNGGTTTLKNVIVANNLGGNNCGGTAVPPVTSQGNNLDSGLSCGLMVVGDQVVTDPLLGPLQNNGGPTQTQALGANSPAINAGGTCPPPNADQRGVTRPQGTACDIGAYEFGVNPPTATPTTTPGPTATITPTVPSPTPTATFVPCPPQRPPVGVSVVPATGGRMLVTVTSSTAGGATFNRLVRIHFRFPAGANAIVDIPGNQPPTISTDYTLELGATTTQSTFFVRQAGAGAAATVRLTVHDTCGPWDTFVGGGTSAYATATLIPLGPAAAGGAESPTPSLLATRTPTPTAVARSESTPVVAPARRPALSVAPTAGDAGR